jgi:hypothetical protein
VKKHHRRVGRVARREARGQHLFEVAKPDAQPPAKGLPRAGVDDEVVAEDRGQVRPVQLGLIGQVRADLLGRPVLVGLEGLTHHGRQAEVRAGQEHPGPRGHPGRRRRGRWRSDGRGQVLEDRGQQAVIALGPVLDRRHAELGEAEARRAVEAHAEEVVARRGDGAADQLAPLGQDREQIGIRQRVTDEQERAVGGQRGHACAVGREELQLAIGALREHAGAGARRVAVEHEHQRIRAGR